MSSTRSASNTDWVASLSPWPEEFGLERIGGALDWVGRPEVEPNAIHVVGTNGKSTATRTIAALLRSEGLRVGAYTSPHVSGWHERLDSDPETFERIVGSIRDVAERWKLTQFETLTLAAFVLFREEKVDVAVVEAGLGGRLDATNVMPFTRVVLLTNVALEHTEVLGNTTEAIAREKLAVARPSSIVVLGEPEWAFLVPGNDVRFGGAREAAEAFLGRPPGPEPEIHLPGRLEWRGEDELRDGAHTPEAVDWLLARLPRREWTIVASILQDKDADAMLWRLSRAGRSLIATRSSNPRALPEKELGARAEPYFEHVEIEADPIQALRRARELGPVLVTGSLYLLADLHEAE